MTNEEILKIVKYSRTIYENNSIGITEEIARMQVIVDLMIAMEHE